MVEVPLTIACGNYDRTQAIRDGRVKVEGCAVTYLPLYPEEIFHRVFKFQEFQNAAENLFRIQRQVSQSAPFTSEKNTPELHSRQYLLCSLLVPRKKSIP